MGSVDGILCDAKDCGLGVGAGGRREREEEVGSLNMYKKPCGGELFKPSIPRGMRNLQLVLLTFSRAFIMHERVHFTYFES